MEEKHGDGSSMKRRKAYENDKASGNMKKPRSGCCAEWGNRMQSVVLYRATDRIKRIDRLGIRHTGHVDLAVIVAAVHLFQFFDVHFLIRDILEIHGDLAERMEEDKKIDRDDQFRSS